MLQYSFHEIENTDVYGVISILDYEPTVRSILEQITFPSSNRERSIIVDLALKSGLNQYRFLRLDVSKSGRVVWKRDAYYKAPSSIEQRANSFLKEKAEYVKNSVLSDITVERFLNEH